MGHKPSPTRQSFTTEFTAEPGIGDGPEFTIETDLRERADGTWDLVVMCHAGCRVKSFRPRTFASEDDAKRWMKAGAHSHLIKFHRTYQLV